jgi:RNA polymerase sigma factor (sigma-70 family)
MGNSICFNLECVNPDFQFRLNKRLKSYNQNLAVDNTSGVSLVHQDKVLLVEVNSGNIKTMRYKISEWLRSYKKVYAIICDANSNDVQDAMLTGFNGIVHFPFELNDLEELCSNVYSQDFFLCTSIINIWMNNIICKKMKLDEQAQPTKCPISEREKDIVKLICAEMTNEEIANQLCISKGTVDKHRKNILKKLNVRNTAGMIKMAYLYSFV